MSPLSLIYLLMASPIFSGHYETSTPFSSLPWNVPSWSNWGFEPSSWNTLPYSSWTPFESSTFGEHSFEPMHLNWLLRKTLRTSTLSPRSLLKEMTGRFDVFEPTFSTPLNFVKIVKVIRRLAETNPIVLEKIVRCPEVRFFVSKMLRHVEPETLILVEKLIRENIPVAIREKITRRLIKNLIKSNVFEYSPRSIMSELYSPRFESSSIFSHYSPMSKVIRRLVKSNVFGEKNILSHKFEKVSVLRKLIKKVLRNPVERVAFCNYCENTCTPYSYSPICKVCSTVCPTMMNTMSSVFEPRFESRFESPIFESRRFGGVESVLPFALEKITKKMNFCNFCNTVCEPTTWSTSSIFSSHELPICNFCNTVCESEHTWPMHKLSKKLTKSSPLSWF